MKIVVNADGSTTVECDGQNVTIQATPLPTDPVIAPGPFIQPGGLSTFFFSLGMPDNRLVSELTAHRQAGGLVERDGRMLLQVQVAGPLDIDTLRTAMTEAGFDPSTGIEIVPPPRAAPAHG